MPSKPHHRHRFAVRLECGQQTHVTLEVDCGTIDLGKIKFDPATKELVVRMKVLCQFPHHNDPPTVPPTTPE
jgi:hypothetical protein